MILNLLLSLSLALSPVDTNKTPEILADSSATITRSISLEKRYHNSFVNDVFRDNILLTIKYMDGAVKSTEDISWEEINKPFTYEFSLQPSDTFSFHDTLLPDYKDKVTKTTNAHFNYEDGFKTDGFLYGDGVCHLASLIYWAAKDAGLKAVSKANHDFAYIPEIPKEYGVSIVSRPGDPNSSAIQNLYITNNKKYPVNFIFSYQNSVLTLSVVDSPQPTPPSIPSKMFAVK